MSNHADIPNNIAPAHKVGGMRVKAPDAHRTHLKQDKHSDEEQEGEAEDDDDEEERMRIISLQERQAQDMQAHTASRQPDISKNAGSNVKQTFNCFDTQPRSMNH